MNKCANSYTKTQAIQGYKLRRAVAENEKLGLGDLPTQEKAAEVEMTRETYQNRAFRKRVVHNAVGKKTRAVYHLHPGRAVCIPNGVF